MNVIIVGGGRVGTHLTRLLLEERHGVKVIEIREEEVRHLHDALPAGTVISGSGTDPETLKSSGIGEADVLAAVTGSDQTNLVATCLARFEFAVPRTIARVKDPRNGWMFNSVMGVDVALSQANLMAHLIVEEMSLGSMMTLLKLSKGEFSLVEEKVHPQASAAGKALAELHLPAECILAGVIRDGRLIIPHGNTVLQPGDEVLAVVHTSAAGQLAFILGG
ncbi:MAG: TrkA family potassium uptake protein [Deltaproteobacteria bacterium]|nr:TrkA family potassium uptake protein [Deltaproteobacteria bacterium]